MASARVSRAAVSLGFDMAVFVLGVGVALPAVGILAVATAVSSTRSPWCGSRSSS